MEGAPLNGGNNVNGIDGERTATAGVGSSSIAWNPVPQIWEAYVRQVLETLHDLDNVLYEVVNEATPSRFPGNTSSFVFIKRYERERGFMAHPVGMTFFSTRRIRGGDNRTPVRKRGRLDLARRVHQICAKSPGDRRTSRRCWIPIISTGSRAIRTTSGRVLCVGITPSTWIPLMRSMS